MAHDSHPLPAPDFRTLFESAPGVYLVLTRDLVKEMVAALGGPIELDSEPGVGSTFSVVSPAAASEAARATA